MDTAANTFPQSTRLFHGLAASEVDLIVASAKRRRFSAKVVITYQGEPADHFFLLSKGRARFFLETSSGKRQNLMWITPGEVVGAATLVSPAASYPVSAESVRESTALVWDGPNIRSLARRFPQLLHNALPIALDYLEWYAVAHAATTLTAHERLAQVLLGYGPRIGHEVSSGIEIDVTNAELADAAHITAYTASRMISEWQRAGALRKRRGKIILRLPERLLLQS